MKVFTKGLILLVISVFAFTFLIAAAGTTLRGDTLSYDGFGTLNNIQNITLNGEPLFIIDNNGPFLKVYFNLPRDEVIPFIEQSVNVSFISNTSTGFLGDVNNIDDVNRFSRFRETNINNGTNASAGFIGVNNAGHSVSIGIASDNFEFMSVPAPNIGVLRLSSPSGMLFLNDFITGYFWLSDQNDSAGVQDPLTTMTLDPIGNLNVTSNITLQENVIYKHSLQPDGTLGFVKMFCKSNNKCYIIREDGTQRRLLDSGAGSDHIDEEWIFDVVPVMAYMNGTFAGGQAYVCIYDNGTMFSSDSAC